MILAAGKGERMLPSVDEARAFVCAQRLRNADDERHRRAVQHVKDAELLVEAFLRAVFPISRVHRLPEPGYSENSESHQYVAWDRVIKAKRGRSGV